jgi:hypothetical protein
MKFYLRFQFVVVASLLLAGCGGGGGGTSVSQPTSTAVVFSIRDVFGNLTSAANSISGIQVTSTLPRGISPNVSSGRILRIGNSDLKSLKGNASIQFGTYSATTNQVTFLVTANPITANIGFGEFARLTYTTTLSNPPTLADFRAQPLSVKVSGPNAVDLSGKVAAEVGLTTYISP